MRCTSSCNLLEEVNIQPIRGLRGHHRGARLLSHRANRTDPPRKAATVVRMMLDRTSMLLELTEIPAPVVTAIPVSMRVVLGEEVVEEDAGDPT